VFNSNPYRELDPFSNSDPRGQALSRATGHIKAAMSAKANAIEEKAAVAAAKYGANAFGAPGGRPVAGSGGGIEGALGAIAGFAPTAKNLVDRFAPQESSWAPATKLNVWSGAAYQPGTVANSFNYTPRTSFSVPTYNTSAVKFNPSAYTMPSLMGGG
jgi:hypothetical protein